MGTWPRTTAKAAVATSGCRPASAHAPSSQKMYALRCSRLTGAAAETASAGRGGREREGVGRGIEDGGKGRMEGNGKGGVGREGKD